MARIKIDGIFTEVLDGVTILDVARKEGISIPTLCHKDGLDHFSSCMVCIVRDIKTNTFIPSCSALVSDGMEIDASSDEVVRLRKKSVELLLSEHRAECEAPCRIVCPAGYDIPLMNRLLSAGDLKSAIDLALSGTGNANIHCIDCPGYCENACRRKKIDIPVSIRNIQLFVNKSIASKDHVTDPESDSSRHERKRIFSTRIGRIEDEELKEWIKESFPDSPRFREIDNYRSAGAEAGSCMHCDCRAAGDCQLRALARDMSVKDPAGKVVNSPIRKKINYQTGLIFENAKCIKCGLCVRVCDDTKDEPALCFLNRGFVSVISEPLGMEFNEILKTQSAKCVEVCPTGALAYFKKADQ